MVPNMHFSQPQEWLGPDSHQRGRRGLRKRWEGIKCHTLPVTELIQQHFINDLMVLHSVTQHTQGLALCVGEKCCVWCVCMSVRWLRVTVTYECKRAASVRQMNECFYRSMIRNHIDTVGLIQRRHFDVWHRCY